MTGLQRCLEPLSPPETRCLCSWTAKGTQAPSLKHPGKLWHPSNQGTSRNGGAGCVDAWVEPMKRGLKTSRERGLRHVVPPVRNGIGTFTEGLQGASTEGQGA